MCGRSLLLIGCAYSWMSGLTGEEGGALLGLDGAEGEEKGGPRKAQVEGMWRRKYWVLAVWIGIGRHKKCDGIGMWIGNGIDKEVGLR